MAGEDPDPLPIEEVDLCPAGVDPVSWEPREGVDVEPARAIISEK